MIGQLGVNPCEKKWSSNALGLTQNNTCLLFKILNKIMNKFYFLKYQQKKTVKKKIIPVTRYFLYCIWPGIYLINYLFICLFAFGFFL